MLSAGTPPLAQLLIIIALSVLLAWVYVASGDSLTAAVLLHGGQNVFVFLNGAIPPTAAAWLMTAVYSAAALLIVLIAGPRLGQRPAAKLQPIT
jgi:hypothetical protein